MHFLHIFLILFPAPYTLGVMSLEIDGIVDLGPKWNYEYRIKHVTTTEPADRALRTPKEVKSEAKGPKLMDIIIKHYEGSPDLMQIVEAESVNDSNKTILRHVKKKHAKSVPNVGNTVSTLSDKFTVLGMYLDKAETKHKDKKLKRLTIENNKNKSHKKNLYNLTRLTEESNIHGVSELITTPKPKILKKNKNLVSDTQPLISNQTKTKLNQRLLSNQNKTKPTKDIIIENFTKRVTALVDNFKYKPMYIEPQLVKYDPKIKEFTRHVYEQSIKVFENIKKKMTNYQMKKEVDHLMRSYEDKFSEFVRETQNQKIRTRLGKQKVILNTFDTSNRILGRLVNYLIGKMDFKGVLRNEGTENVLQNEIQKKIDLENKHICNKLQICRSNESFSKFVTDILNIVLSSDDRKITMVKDATTEVLKETDFSHAMYADTEKRYRKGLGDMEKYDAFTMRPIFFIMKNLVANKNAPITVVGPVDSRLNKTIAFLDIIDTWEQKLPPNEKNVLEWTDMTNSFRDWSDGKRNDIKDLMQSFTDHVMQVMNNFDADEAKNFDRNINIMLGY